MDICFRKNWIAPSLSWLFPSYLLPPFLMPQSPLCYLVGLGCHQTVEHNHWQSASWHWASSSYGTCKHILWHICNTQPQQSAGEISSGLAFVTEMKNLNFDVLHICQWNNKNYLSQMKEHWLELLDIFILFSLEEHQIQ